jgi:hypothetical protein
LLNKAIETNVNKDERIVGCENVNKDERIVGCICLLQNFIMDLEETTYDTTVLPETSQIQKSCHA